VRLPISGEYPPNRAELHDQVRAEAGHRCIRCGHPDETPSNRVPCDDRCSHAPDGKQRILTVHHLDGNKSNSRWWNLLALCQVCHLTIQGKLIPERPYLWEHSAWFKPYVAGFYAHYHHGVDLSRAKIESNLDHWLCVGQPWRAPAPEGTQT
jgi:5-methylcytosine-specific restriction endonuclease McrA